MVTSNSNHNKCRYQPTTQQFTIMYNNTECNSDFETSAIKLNWTGSSLAGLKRASCCQDLWCPQTAWCVSCRRVRHQKPADAQCHWTERRHCRQPSQMSRGNACRDGGQTPRRPMSQLLAPQPSHSCYLNKSARLNIYKWNKLSKKCIN